MPKFAPDGPAFRKLAHRSAEFRTQIVTGAVALVSLLVIGCEDSSKPATPKLAEGGIERVHETEEELVQRLQGNLRYLETQGRDLFGIDHTWQLPGYTSETRDKESEYSKALWENGTRILPEEFTREALRNGESLTVVQEVADSSYLPLLLWYNRTATKIEDLHDPRTPTMKRASILLSLERESPTSLIEKNLERIREVME